MPTGSRARRDPTDDWDQLRLLVASPQPFLSPLDEVRWHPAQPMEPYRPRRERVNAGAHEPLFDGEREAAAN